MVPAMMIQSLTAQQSVQYLTYVVKKNTQNLCAENSVDFVQLVSCP